MIRPSVLRMSRLSLRHSSLMVRPPSSVDQFSVSLLTSKATLRIRDVESVVDFFAWRGWFVVVEFIWLLSIVLSNRRCPNRRLRSKMIKQILVIQLVNYVERSHFNFFNQLRRLRVCGPKRIRPSGWAFNTIDNSR